MSVDDDENGKDARKSKLFGCGTMMTVVGAAMLTGGIYAMTRWETLGGISKTFAIVLVVLGTLALLPFVLFTAIRIVIKVWFGKVMKDLEKASKDLATAGGDMLAGNKAMYEKIHTFRAADEDDFESTDRRAYEKAQRQLSDLGFRHLGDIVDETIEELTGMTAVIRVMASTDGTTVVGCYTFTPPVLPGGGGGKQLLICDLASEFTDGTFFATSNTQGVDLTTAATGIARQQHPVETALADLVQKHESDKQKLLAAKSEAGTECVVINTLDDALESERRQQAIKNAFRKQIGYVDPEEVRRMAKTVDDDGDFGNAAARAADQARKKERSDSAGEV